MPSFRSPAVIIAASLVLGLGAGELVRRFVFRESPDKNTGTPAAMLKTATSENAAAHLRPAPLSEMSTADFDLLMSMVRAPSSGPGGRIRNEHDIKARLLDDLKSAADCARAASLIEEAPSTIRQSLTEIIFRKWTVLDPAGALGAADKLKNWPCQRKAVELVLKKWAELDAAAALQAVISAPPGYVRQRGLQSILSAVTKDDPARGLQLISQLPHPDPAALSQVLSSWTANDPQAAWKWAKAQTDPARLEQSTRAVLSGMAYSGRPDPALELARQESAGRLRRQMISTVLESWIRKDNGSALARAAALPVDDFTPEMAHSMVRSAFNILNGYSMGAPDPKKWADAQINQFPPGPYREAVRAAIAVHVLTFNLGREFQAGAALPLLADMADGPWKSRATADLAAAWTHTDAVAASEWLASLPKSPTRDAAVARFVERISLSDPERARQWAETIHMP